MPRRIKSGPLEFKRWKMGAIPGSGGNFDIFNNMQYGNTFENWKFTNLLEGTSCSKEGGRSEEAYH